MLVRCSSASLLTSSMTSFRCSAMLRRSDGSCSIGSTRSSKVPRPSGNAGTESSPTALFRVSFNHYSYGAIGHWLYRVVAGIDLDPQFPGYKHILVSRQPGGGINWASGRFQNLYGEIVSAWEAKPNGFRLDVTIPANATATVRLPGAVLSRVKEGGEKVVSAPGIITARQEQNAVALEVGSGQYRFEYEF